MTVRSRLIFLLISLAVLLAVGRSVTGGFEFVLTQFWFTSGFFLLLLLSLIDQPHFSKDANIFVNGTTAWVSLLLVPASLRTGVWWAFFGWAAYLLISSYALMWLRARELYREPAGVRIVARVNRQIGRPEAIFSALFLWGAVLQFGSDSGALSPLFLFWAVFMILNLPSLSAAIDAALSRPRGMATPAVGVLDRVISPRVAEALMAMDAPMVIVGRDVSLKTRDGHVAADAVVIDDRIIAGGRRSRLAITSTTDHWRQVGSVGGDRTEVHILDLPVDDSGRPISIVDAGSEIGKLVFFVHPELELQAGEVLWTQHDGDRRAFYQVISATVLERAMQDGNAMHTVRVTAGELGMWDEQRCRFEPINWVAPAGQLVHRVAKSAEPTPDAPDGSEVVGWVPNSSFPVHVVIRDVVTHNTAIIGVTGSGKSFLAFHLIDAMVRSGIKVLVLDISRQHDLYLAQHNPTALRTSSEVAAWIAGDSSIGIHQFAVDAGGYPKATADFADAAFAEVSKARLERGKNIPARLCIVFEEAHSLIPEWNQVAQQGDVQQVNRTARSILQGRKFGMGALVITQRTANVTKTILNQCNTIFAMQSFDQTGLDFLRNYMGEEYSHAISTLPTRHAILVGMASSSTRPILMRVADMTNRWQETSTATNELERADDGTE